MRIHRQLAARFTLRIPYQASSAEQGPMVNDLRSRTTAAGKGLCCAALLALSPACVFAGDVAVLAARLHDEGGGRWSASVTLEHADTGWDHYADAWRVVGKGGVIYATRTLFHPHESEQPFTRALANIVIPKAEGSVYIEAHDKVHGWARQRLQLDLTTARDGTVQVSR